MKAEHHDPRKYVYRAFPYALRSIGNYSTNSSPWSFEREVCLDRHAETVGEMIHVSVLLRLGNLVRQEKIVAPYRPKNVLSVIDVIAASYGASGLPKPPRPIRIVQWDGRPLHPTEDRAAALAIISSARERLSKPLKN
jgi:hypothetical protein